MSIEKEFDGWNIALSVASITEDKSVCSRYGIDDWDKLKKVFPRAIHPDPDKIIPDSILSWNQKKTKPKYSD